MTRLALTLPYKGRYQAPGYNERYSLASAVAGARFRTPATPAILTSRQDALEFRATAFVEVAGDRHSVELRVARGAGISANVEAVDGAQLPRPHLATPALHEVTLHVDDARGRTLRGALENEICVWWCWRVA